ncbi:MAG: sugar phosphate nucleotidyltransferase, partial [Candidatus Woesearchaeota archaeon]
MKERVTITLDSTMLAHLDSLVDQRRFKNRSHVIESILRDAVKINRPKKAVILAGGKGSRLYPITQEIPKPMLPVKGKPIIEHLIDFFKANGIKDIILSVGFKKEVIKDYFGSGAKLGISITYIEEDEPLGTAGPLVKAKHLLTETFVVSNGDELKDFDLADMYLMHKQTNALATIALTQVENPEEYGAVLLQGNKIVAFLEKSKKNIDTNLINSGLYLFEPEIFSYLTAKGKLMFETDVFPVLAKQEKLYGYPFVGQW